MIGSGFSYSFTMKELGYLLFAKKICPECGGKLAKDKSFDMAKGRELNSKADPTFVSSADIKAYKYIFSCPACGYSRPVGHAALEERKR